MFIGDKTVSWVDIWTLEHLASGISLGGFLRQRSLGVWTCVALAYAWESLEHYLELGLAGAGVAFWFHGAKYWGNRLIADPIVTVSGFYLAARWTKLVLWSRVFSVLWLTVHVLFLQHSMQLQEWLFR